MKTENKRKVVIHLNKYSTRSFKDSNLKDNFPPRIGKIVLFRYAVNDATYLTKLAQLAIC